MCPFWSNTVEVEERSPQHLSSPYPERYRSLAANATL